MNAPEHLWRRLTMVGLAVVALHVLTFHGPAKAQGSSPERAAAPPVERMSAEDMVERLAKPRTRSLRNLAPRLDLSVRFDFDSAQLQSSSHELLENLARALNTDALRDQRIRVEGHTDAVGTARYNEALSQRRAESVVAFLVQAGVERQRLEPRGLGASDLLYPDDPRAAGNRRVRVMPVQP